MKFCRQCGNPMEDKAVFCPKCGAEMPVKNSEVKPAPDFVEESAISGQSTEVGTLTKKFVNTVCGNVLFMIAIIAASAAAFFNFITCIVGMSDGVTGFNYAFLDALATLFLGCGSLWLLFIASKNSALISKTSLCISLLKIFFLVSLAWHATGLLIEFIGTFLLMGDSMAISRFFGFHWGQSASMFFDMLLFKGTKVVFVLFSLLLIVKLEKSLKENKADISAVKPFIIGCFAHAGGGFLASFFANFYFDYAGLNVFTSMLTAGALVLFAILALQITGNRQE